eukprot:403341897
MKTMLARDEKRIELFDSQIYKEWINKDNYLIYQTWQDEHIKKLELVNADIINDETLDRSFREAALSLEILYLKGGVYFDMKMCGIYSVNDLLDHPTDFIIGLSNTRTFELNNAFIASRPKHPLLKHLIDALNKKYQAHLELVAQTNQANQEIQKFNGLKGEDILYQTIDYSRMIGPGFMTQQIFTYLNENKNSENGQYILITPKQFFYPLSQNPKSVKESHEKATPSNYYELLDKLFEKEGKVVNSKDGIQIENPIDDSEIPNPILTNADLGTIVYGCYLWELDWQI